MFIVFHKEINKPFMVYEVREIQGFVQFLVYKDNQWQYEYASEFRPMHRDTF